MDTVYVLRLSRWCWGTWIDSIWVVHPYSCNHSWTLSTAASRLRVTFFQMSHTLTSSAADFARLQKSTRVHSRVSTTNRRIRTEMPQFTNFFRSRWLPWSRLGYEIQQCFSCLLILSLDLHRPQWTYAAEESDEEEQPAVCCSFQDGILGGSLSGRHRPSHSDRRHQQEGVLQAHEWSIYSLSVTHSLLFGLYFQRHWQWS